MKKSIWMTAALAALFTIGCSTGDEPVAPSGDQTRPGQQDEPAVAPVVPDDFAWEMFREVGLTLTSPVSTRVDVYWDEACTGESLLAERVLLEAGKPLRMPFTVPADIETLHVVYPAAAGGEGKAAVALRRTRNAETFEGDYDFAADVVRTHYDQVENFQYWYNSGVVMVEDQWPDFTVSDADFNDLVVEYDLKTVECTTPEMLPTEGYKEGIVLTLDIRGIGSGRTRMAGLRFTRFPTDVVTRVDSHIYEKSGQGEMREITDDRFRIEVDRSRAGELTVWFDGLDKLVNGRHYQTTEGQIETGRPMIRAWVKLSGVEDRSKLTPEASRRQAEIFRDVVTYAAYHDFFMVTRPAYGSVEIHQKGFAPTDRYTSYETDAKGLMSSVPYCSVGNDVWVLRLPVGTRHAYDRVSLFDAYPGLKGWVESGGAENRDWYRLFVDSKVAPRW